METSSKIAIIGYSCSVAGANNANELYQLCANKELGLSQHKESDYKDELPEDFYQSDSFRAVGGGPADYKNFDAKFFGYSPKEANYLDPQIRKSLEHSWRALEHSGYAPMQINEKTGVFFAKSLSSYFLENLAELYQHGDEALRSQLVFLNETDFLASRIAYHLNLTGPAVAVQCGCSSSLAAVHQACQSLNEFDCDFALAGGVAIKPRYQYGYQYEQDGILSADGYCRPFDSDASGTVFGNGIGVVVLKRLEDAIEANDTIFAVLASTAANNDGNDKIGYMAPSTIGQQDVIESALSYADLNQRDISYVESHGTGTALGDPIEFDSLCKVFSDVAPHSITLGAIKANIGHVDAASGVVALIKILKEIEHKTQSAIANFSKPNPKLQYKNSPFVLREKTANWAESDSGRNALVCSYGIGGTNIAAVVSEYVATDNNQATDPEQHFYAFSAKTAQALEQQLQAWQQQLTTGSYEQVNLADLAYTLAYGRMHFAYRFGFSAKTFSEFKQAVTDFSSDKIKHCQSSGIMISALDLISESAAADNWLAGADVDITEPDINYQRVPCQGTEFAKTEYWHQLSTNSKAGKIKDVSKWFYLPYWQREQVANFYPKLAGKKVLILADNQSFADCFAQKLQQLEAKPTIIALAKHSFADYDELFTNLQNQNKLPDYVVHCSSLTQAELSFSQTQELGLYSLMYLCQAAVKITGDIYFKLAVITNKMANVSGTETIYPGKATLTGISQVVPKEYSKAITNLIDIDLNSDPKLTVDNILYELATEKNSEIALRNSMRFKKAYCRRDMQANTLGDISIKSGGNYLVIGGLGNFGLELSEFIGSFHCGNVFLTTRANFPAQADWQSWLNEHGENNSVSQKIIALTDIIANGAKVEVLRCDVTSKQDLENIKTAIEADYGPINGIVHAAGIVDAGMIQTKTVESVETVFAAKVTGTELVCQTFLPAKPDFIILCSSMNSIIGGLGQLDNTAANAYVDAYAEYCLNQGHSNVLAINWGAVNEARARNYSDNANFAKMSEEHIKNRMTKTEIFDVYNRLFATHFSPRVIVSTIDFKQVVINWTKVGSLQELLKPVAVAKKQRQELIAADIVQPETKTSIYISSLWCDALGLDEISLTDNFFELGGNSLIAIQFISQVAKKYQVRIHAMSIYEYLTLGEFADYVDSMHADMLQKQRLMA